MRELRCINVGYPTRQSSNLVQLHDVAASYYFHCKLPVGYKESLGLWDGIGGIFIVAGLIQTVFAESDNDDYTPLFGDVRRKSLDETYADSFSSYSDDEMELMIKANSFTGVSNGSVAFQI
jgi:hypothetical protein